MSKPTVKELADRLTDRDVKESIAARILAFKDSVNHPFDKEMFDRLFPPEPEWKPLRLEWEQDGAKLRFRCVEIDERDDRSYGFISPDPYAKGAFKIDMYRRGRTGFDDDMLRIVIGCFDRTWSDWKTFPSESDATAFYDKAGMAVYELNKKRGCKSDLPYNTMRKIEQPWTPLIIAFRKNQDGQWEGQIISQDERDRKHWHVHGEFGGVKIQSASYPDWSNGGPGLRIRGGNEDRDLDWFRVGTDADVARLQAAVREFNRSRGITVVSAM